MNSLVISSYLFIFIALLMNNISFKEGLKNNILYLFIFSLSISQLLFTDKIFSSNYLFLVISPALVFAANFINKKKISIVTCSLFLIVLFSIQNLNNSTFYIFLALIEGLYTLNLIENGVSENIIKEYSYSILVKLIILVFMFVISSFENSSLNEKIIYPIILCFLFLNSYYYTSIEDRAYDYKTSRYWKYTYLVFIPLTLLLRLNSIEFKASFDHVEVLNLYSCLLICLLALSIFLRKNIKSDRSALILSLLPYYLVYMVSEIINLKAFIAINIFMYFISELIIISHNKYLKNILENIQYNTVINPLAFFIIVEIMKSNKSILLKGLMLIPMAVSWIQLLYRKKLTKGHFSRKRDIIYLVITLCTIGIYINEAI